MKNHNNQVQGQGQGQAQEGQDQGQQGQEQWQLNQQELIEENEDMDDQDEEIALLLSSLENKKVLDPKINLSEIIDQKDALQDQSYGEESKGKNRAMLRSSSLFERLSEANIDKLDSGRGSQNYPNFDEEFNPEIYGSSSRDLSLSSGNFFKNPLLPNSSDSLLLAPEFLGRRDHEGLMMDEDIPSNRVDIHEMIDSLNGISQQQDPASLQQMQFNEDELELIASGLVTRQEVIQQRAELLRYQDLERGSSFKSQNFPFHGADLSRGDDGLQHEQMAKSGPAKGIDHKFIEGMSRDLKTSIDQDFPSQSYEQKMDEMDSEILGILDKLKSRNGIGQGVFGNQNDDEEMRSLIGSPREQFGNFQDYPDNFTTHQDLDFNQTERELMEAGITIEEIIEQRQFATEQFANQQFILQSGSQNQGEMQPLNAESLDSNSRQGSPSRE